MARHLRPANIFIKEITLPGGIEATVIFIESPYSYIPWPLG